MSRNVLITGGSGYLGGSLLHYLKTSADLPPHDTIYALVRGEEQAKLVKTHYHATPLTIDLNSEGSITSTLLEKRISVVFYLIDASKSDIQVRFIKALGTVRQRLGISMHFLHTSGAKIFSSLVGMPTDRVLSDADPEMYDLQKAARPALEPMLNVSSSVLWWQVFLTDRTASLLPRTIRSLRQAKLVVSRATSSYHASSMAKVQVLATTSRSRQWQLSGQQKLCGGCTKWTHLMA